MLKNIVKYSTPSFLVACLITSCQSAPNLVPVKQPSSAKHTQCTDPRPQMCTKEYRPVCATKDTGIPCVTTPCSSTKPSTYSTACTACSDSKVLGYHTGACP